MKTLYILHWRYDDGSSSGVVPHVFTETEMELACKVIDACSPGRELNWVDAPHCSAGSDTPETDPEATFRPNEDGYTDFVPAELARRLERERDEARRCAEWQRDAYLRLAAGHPESIRFPWESEPNAQE